MRPGNDPYLVWAKTHYRWALDRMGYLWSGDLAVVVEAFIWNRWLTTGKASYAYETAWVFGRDRGTIANVFESLEEKRIIERTSSYARQRRTFYRPSEEEVRKDAERSTVERGPDDFLSHHEKVHNENCPCMKLVERW